MAESPAGHSSAPPPCPARPSSMDPSVLGFVRRPMVRWLDPHQLVDTAARVLLSGIFSSYADNRELQALTPTDVPDRSKDPDGSGSDSSELWLDYVADLGDGWNSTYTVARLLAAEELDLDWHGETHATRRGRLLVMGGDQVYPVPKRAEYENRMLGPYRSAMPCATENGPELFAIPGSHDWYDGLVNFTSIFCHDRWIGGWKTRQHRSYFALKLPSGWWLWGIDVQFGAHLDDAQLGYFSEVAADQVDEGDRIIVCTAKEVQSGRSTNEIFSDRNLDYLEHEVIEPAGARVALHLKSGRHHYCRNVMEDGSRQHITSGGGGAFLHPTHRLPEELIIPGREADGKYRRASVYPSADVSRKLRKRVWLLPFFNLPLAAAFGTLQVLLAFMMGLQLHNRYVSLNPVKLTRAVWESPTAFVLIVFMVVLLAGMVRFAHDASGVPRVVLGLVHAALQLSSVGGVMIAASWLSTDLVASRGTATMLLFLVLVAVLGGIGGTFGMSGYFWATNCLGFHGNEAYAPLHHMDLKHFLRLHFGADGVLTLYPVAIDRVGRHWKLNPDAPDGAPWFAPDGPEPAVRLIEKPVRIDADRRPPAQRPLGPGHPAQGPPAAVAGSAADTGGAVA